MVSEKPVPVLIIGAGVVGLSASLFLAQHGVKSIVIERRSGTSVHPRARSVNARTMELFRRLGITDHVREAGASIAPSVGIFQGSSLREVIEAIPRKEEGRKFPITGLMESVSPVSGTFVTQDMLEPVLVDETRRRRIKVQFSTECIDVQQDEGSVTATLKGHQSEDTFNIRADYLIAADGAKSPIRTQLKVPTTGRGPMGHLLNVLFHADLKDLVCNREFSLCMVERPDVAEYYTPEKCKELLRIALGIPDIDIDIKSILPWEPTVRVAERLQHGRIFLAGDAAHQMPPYAGQGANSGIADAHNLAWKLAAVLNGHAGKDLLHTYDVERLPVGRGAAEISAAGVDDRGLLPAKKNLEFYRGMWKKGFIVAGFGYGYNSKAISAENTSPLGGWTWRPWTVSSLVFAIDGRPGRRVPHIRVEREGEQISTLDVCRKSFVLLVGADGAYWFGAVKKVSLSLGIDIDSYCVGPKGDLVTSPGIFEAAMGITSSGAILVRPDDFVTWRARRRVDRAEAQLESILKQVLCLG